MLRIRLLSACQNGINRKCRKFANVVATQMLTADGTISVKIGRCGLDGKYYGTQQIDSWIVEWMVVLSPTDVEQYSEEALRICEIKESCDYTTQYNRNVPDRTRLVVKYTMNPNKDKIQDVQLTLAIITFAIDSAKEFANGEIGVDTFIGKLFTTTATLSVFTDLFNNTYTYQQLPGFFTELKQKGQGETANAVELPIMAATGVHRCLDENDCQFQATFQFGTGTYISWLSLSSGKGMIERAVIRPAF